MKGKERRYRLKNEGETKINKGSNKNRCQDEEMKEKKEENLQR